MFRQVSRAARRRPGGTALSVALALLALAGAARVLAPASLEGVADFPRVRPVDLAHLLADVSVHDHIPSSWTLEEEEGNYTSWRYVAAYACGARCSGRTAVHAHEQHVGGPAHGARSPLHRVLVRRTHCRSPPLLPWPQLCEEIETEWVVTGDVDVAHLQERTRAACGAAAALLAQCAGARQLGDERAARLRRLRDLLHQRALRPRA